MTVLFILEIELVWREGLRDKRGHVIVVLVGVRKEGGIVILAGQGSACQLKVVHIRSGGIVRIWEEQARKDR